MEDIAQYSPHRSGARDENVCSESDAKRIALPQPHLPEVKYLYLAQEDMQKRYFPNSHYDVDTLVWVLKSKGRKHKSKASKIHSHATCQQKKSVEDNKSNDYQTNSSSSASSRTELFLRARVVRPEGEDRIVVRYPKGSTYKVRRSNLIPVLEAGRIQKNKEYVVLVTSETCDYRRLSAVHICVGESFLEIGCDFGTCTDRVRQVLMDFEDVPLRRCCSDEVKSVIGGSMLDEIQNIKLEDARTAPTSPEFQMNTTDKSVAIGVDKSSESIAVALKRCPRSSFFPIDDILTDSGASQLRDLCCENLLYSCPSVVAIDINGSRELPAVLQCIQMVMRYFVPSEDNYLTTCMPPRLIVVKSRTLYNYLKQAPLKFKQAYEL